MTTTPNLKEKESIVVSASLEFVRSELISIIIERNDDLKAKRLISSKVTKSEHLDGLMSIIIFVELLMECPKTNQQSTTSLIVKLMRGDTSFRETTVSYPQFSNEIHIYLNVITAFKSILKKNSSIKIDEWVPRIYYSYYGPQPSLGNGPESILVMENLKPLGYRSGPRLNLDEKHLRLMITKIAEFHSFTYAMKIRKDPKLEELIKGIQHISFINPNPSKPTIFDVIYRIGLSRFFKYLDDNSDALYQQNGSAEFWSDVKNLRDKVSTKPTVFMERVVTKFDDEAFPVIIHGDYNRNNILFKYSTDEGFDNPIDLRMIDFQETRYTSPAVDLSFFMYINMDPELQSTNWDTLLQQYHSTLIKCLCETLNCNADDPCLANYSFDKFLAHFSKHAIYGVMTAIQFLPWNMSPDNEQQKLIELFEKDMTSVEFNDMAMVVGGDVPHCRMFEIIQHASQKGYMKSF